MERKDRISHKLKTIGIWGPAPKRFIRFLNRIEDQGLPKTLAILGCSDGGLVIPAAKNGFEVLAIDVDRIALFGGVAVINRKPAKVNGLVNRLKQEGVTKSVTIVNQDFFTYHPMKTYSGVFTSGSIHYRENSKYSLVQITDQIKNYVSDNGLLLFEYIHVTEENQDPNRHYVSGKQIAQYFRNPGWNITSNKRKTYIEGPNPRSDHFHKITWGRMYAQRNTFIVS